MKQSSKRLTSVILALLFVIAALIILFDLIEPEYATMMTTKGKVEGEQAFLIAQQTAITQAQTILTSYEGQGQTTQNISLALPPSEDQAGALAQIYGIAGSSGLSVQSVSVSSPTIQSQGGAAKKSLIKPLAAISFQIAAAGSYESLKNFINGIQTNIRLFDLKSISITPAATTGAAKDFFNYNVAVISYYQTP